MHGAHDLAPRLGVEPVGELRQPLVQSVPELNASGNRWRRLDRAQARDMLVADLAVLPAGLHQTHFPPLGRLPEVHQHPSGTMRGSPNVSRSFLAGRGLSWLLSPALGERRVIRSPRRRGRVTWAAP